MHAKDLVKGKGIERNGGEEKEGDLMDGRK